MRSNVWIFLCNQEQLLWGPFGDPGPDRDTLRVRFGALLVSGDPQGDLVGYLGDRHLDFIDLGSVLGLPCGSLLW